MRSPVLMMTFTAGLYATIVHGWFWGLLVALVVPLSVPILTIFIYYTIYSQRGELFIEKVVNSNWFINLQIVVFSTIIALIFMTNENINEFIF